MIPILDSTTWTQHINSLQRPGNSNFLAFYDYSIDSICCDPKQMLIPIDDHLVHRGDGIFETLRITQNTILQLDEHMDRLQKSAEGISLYIPLTKDELKTRILAVAKASNSSEGYIRILVGRGPGGFAITPNECPKSSLYIIFYKSHPITEHTFQKGLTACRSELPAKTQELAKIKTTNYILNVLMTLEATSKHVDLTLTFDHNNCLAEAATANIAIIDNLGSFIIPKFKHTLVGTTVVKIKKIAKLLMPTITRCIQEQEIYSAQELLALGTTYECIGITHYNNKPIKNGKTGPMSHKLRSLLKETLLVEGTLF